jgi:hypothetical protein
MSDIEGSDADVLEQRLPVVGDDRETAVAAVHDISGDLPLEANEADVLEQAEELPPDEDFL